MASVAFTLALPFCLENRHSFWSGGGHVSPWATKHENKSLAMGEEQLQRAQVSGATVLMRLITRKKMTSWLPFSFFFIFERYILFCGFEGFVSTKVCHIHT